MSHVKRKPAFGVSDQVRHKPACAATEASKRLEISDIETRDIILSRQLSAPLLVAYGINMFSYHLAHIISID